MRFPLGRILKKGNRGYFDKYNYKVGGEVAKLSIKGTSGSLFSKCISLNSHFQREKRVGFPAKGYN